MQIIPAIIPKDFEDLEEKMSNVRGLVPLVQVDVLDGSLMPLRCWPYQSGAKRDAFFDSIMAEESGFPFWQELEFEAHLMVKEPERIISDWISAGAARIIMQAEGIKDFKKCFETVAGRVPVGVAFALDTPFDVLKSFAENLEVIQCMGWGFSNLGRQGEALEEQIFSRIKELHAQFPEIAIAVDGGVNLENAPALRSAGATRLVVGSTLWKNGSIRENLKKFKESGL